MADTILGTAQTTGLTENQASTIITSGTALSTGDLRRRYDWSEKVAVLSPNLDPFFIMLSKYRKRSVDETQFKFTEERSSVHKRYAYVTAHGTTSSVSTDDATVTETNIEQGDTYYWKMETDYKSDGNIGNKYGQTSGEIQIGATGTRPKFFIPGLHIKIPFSTAFNAGVKDFVVARIEEVTVSSEAVILKTKILRELKTATNNELTSYSAAGTNLSSLTLSTYKISGTTDCLEAKRTYVSGNSWGKGTGYPETWGDNPYSTGEGQTEIMKTALGMDNSTIATVLKYKGNEFARLWGNKTLEHRWDIATGAYFSTLYTDSDGLQHTQGVVDYALSYGHVFSWSTAKDCDAFLADLSEFYDPRLQNAVSTIHFCDRQVYNWLNTLSGYFQQGLEVSTNFRSDFMFSKRGTMGGVAVNQISTIYGDFNFTYDPHLDGSPVKILSVPINNVEYRPLVGNGKNRDTAVYPGVQSLETTGVDAEVSLILTEMAVTEQLPETWSIWTL